MKKYCFFAVAGILACTSMLTGQGAAPTKAADCLACHGSYEKIAEATAGYVAPSKEKGTPHRYVPHDSKKDADIPDCTKCHTPHALDPLPAKGSADRSKLGVQYCYDACHHEKTLETCKNCH